MNTVHNGNNCFKAMTMALMMTVGLPKQANCAWKLAR